MATEQEILSFRNTVEDIRREIGKEIIGQQDVVEHMIMALVAGGNVLLEGVPGLGKTRLVRTLSHVLDLPFSRIQFTPDLMPADITGTNIIVKTTQGNAFEFQPGPLFASIVLADEINRATPKTQSALLEAMQEHCVTVAGVSRPMKEPYFVLATQNPVEQEGTYPLPEAQLDRFFMRVSIGYPSADEETEILDRYASGKKPIADLKPICTSSDILRLQQEVEGVYSAKEIRSYIAAIAAASRRTNALQLGVSTRAAISLLRAAQANALLDGRDYVSPEDVKRMAEPVLAHRLVLSPEARMRNMTAEKILAGVIGSVPVPVKVK